MREKNEILDTGGGVLNAINNFSNYPFIIINPDTIWNLNYIKELKQMESSFLSNKKKCYLLVVNKMKSFDTNLKGDFNLQKDLITRKKGENLKYIYTGLQIIDPEVFSDIYDKVFSINKVWNNLIQSNQLFALESSNDFLHVSTLDIYKKLNIK